MQPLKITLFIGTVFLLLGVIGVLMPADGVPIGSLTLKFPSPKSILTVENDTVINVETTMASLKEEVTLSHIKEMNDSLLFFKTYLQQHKSRFHLPQDDYTFLDRFFALLDSAKYGTSAIHITHYGDSQIEMDRITNTFRQTLQEQFSGAGAGIVPAIQTIPTLSVMQSFAGNLSRFAVYGDTSQIRASHRRYGLSGSFAQLDSSATISIVAANYRQTEELVKRFSRVILLFGNNTANFSAVCNGVPRTVSTARKGVTPLVWTLPAPTSRVSLRLNGTAEIYGISLEGTSGVTVDNVPMRGCSGTIFTQMDTAILAQSYRAMNVKMIILQYGGNMIPQINGTSAIERYMKQITGQIRHLQRANPDAVLLFIGLGDMAKRINGTLQTCPFLPALNDSLRNTVTACGGIYWDMFRVMGGHNSIVAWANHSPAWASADYIHFTDVGAKEIATALSDAFMMYYRFYRLRQNCSPVLVKSVMNRIL